jgi:selenide,water dikinase
MIPAGAPAIRHDIVLVGGGHAHVQVMTAFAMHPEKGVRLTLVTDRLSTPYSGMLPGHVAGLYDRDEMHIDLARLARATGARLVHDPAVGIDRAARQVLFADRPPLAYDTVSLDVGITPDVSAIAGAAHHAVAVKPISGFLGRLEAAEAGEKAGSVAVIGGGAAGVELACALRARFGPGPAIAILTAAPLVPTLNAGVRQHVEAALARQRIAVVRDFRAASMDASSVTASDGRVHEAGLVLVSTAARAPAWLAETGLPTTADGFLRIGPTLQVEGEQAIFAVGDCATRTDDPREKAGVFAVRQGPVLADNLRRRVRRETLRCHDAQKTFLVILSTGDERAIAGKAGWLALEGAWVWRWKDWIDRRFMAMFSQFGAAMAKPPSHEAIDAGEAMRCGGCAAKLGPGPLAAALRRLPPQPDPVDNVLVGPGTPDDAAVVSVGGVMQVETVDQITANVSDPHVFGRIAALHALSDVWAMGGVPTRALAIATVPHAFPSIAEADLALLLAGARQELDAHGVALLGGHTGEGERMALGFSVTGRLDPTQLRRKGTVEPGSSLILTKPIGIGVVMAADMRGAAAAEASSAAIGSMLRPNGAAARILAPRASALTDITGFGLCGHLLEMLRPAGLGAMLDLAAVPLLPDALALARAGHRSSLTAQTLALAPAVAHEDGTDADLANGLLFDPQTSGGLLGAVPAFEAEELVEALHEAGYEAAVIGSVTEPAEGAAIRCTGRFRETEGGRRPPFETDAVRPALDGGRRRTS